MNFEYNEDQLAIKDMAKNFAETELMPHANEWDQNEIFPIETFFRWKPKIELNFTLAPIWGRARIEMDTTPGDKTDDWNYFITSFGGSANHVSDMGATAAMIYDWIGYSSLLGFRYYINTRLGVDVKAGFMNNQYKASEWRIQRQKVTGPELKIDDLPIFSIKIIYGLR